MKSGIISVTFRPKTRAEIVELSKEAGLESIIWGGDIHVPHGDLSAAKEAPSFVKTFRSTPPSTDLITDFRAKALTKL